MKYLIILSLLFVAVAAKTQMVINIDSDSAYIAGLEEIISLQESTDSVKATAAFSLSQVYKRGNDSAKTNHYLALGKKLSNGNKLLEGLYGYYEAFAGFGKVDNAVLEKKLKAADSILKNFNSPRAFKARSNIWTALGTFEQLKGSEKNGLNAYLNYALPFAKESGDLFNIGNANKFIGIIFLNSGEREKASAYLREALTNFRNAPDKDNPSKLESLVETSIILAENDVQQNKLAEAKKSLDQVKQLLGPYPNSNIFLFYYFPEGIYYEKTGQYEKALESFNKGIAMNNGSTGNYYINRLKYAKAQTLTKMNRNSEAITTLLDLIESPIILPTDKKLYYKDISIAYAKAGNMAKAYDWSQRYISFSDSLYETKYKADLVELEKQYNTSQHQNKINLLEAEKRKNIYDIKTARLSGSLWAIGCILLLLAASFLYYFLNNNKKLARQKELHHEQELVQINQQQQIALNEAMMKGEELEKQRIARDLHDGLGGMLSGVRMRLSKDVREATDDRQKVDSIIGLLDDSMVELRRIARNMMPETLVRFGIDTSLKDLASALSSPQTVINYESYGIRENIELSQQIVIYRIIQEGLSNALRHANASAIDLQCSQTEDLFYISIEDDGIGFDLSSLRNSKGIGITNIENRVKYLNGKFEIQSEKGVGTSINIELNLSKIVSGRS